MTLVIPSAPPWMKNSGRGSSELSTSIGLHAPSQHRVRSQNINPASQTNGVPGNLLALLTFSINNVRSSLKGLSRTNACTPGSPAAPSSETTAPIE